MGHRTGRSRRHVIVAAALLAASGIGLAGAGGTAGASVVRDGTRPERAGASCWAIKQDVPASTDGIYWLQTPLMVHADQFYCDMTTDGGGWVLIGRGRDNWTFFEYGQGSASEVRSTVDGTAAFAPKALDTATINELLNGGAVKDLTEGVRIRRARNSTGTTWQELRWRYLDLTDWSWALDGGHRLSGFSIDGVNFTGGNTRDSTELRTGEVGTGNRGANNSQRWFTWTWASHANRRGFSYGQTIAGSNSATSYLWTSTNEAHALPFSQVFIRPQIGNWSGTAIPDTGLPAQTLTPMLSDRHETLAAGVVGVLKNSDTEPALDTPVQAFAEYGSRIFVSGKFAQVELGTSGTRENQSYLAAFDRATGAWISDFRPTFDGTVWDLEVVGNRLYVAGEFTNVNGVAGTAGLAALDPLTGAVDTGWQASLAVTGTTARAKVRSLDNDGTWLYIGGNFTSVTTGAVVRPMARAGRVSLATGLADTAFRPDVDGVVYDLDADGDRVYLVGDFFNVDGVSRIGQAIVAKADGELVPGVAQYVPSAVDGTRRYQQAILALGDEVWQGGSEHNTHVYRASDYALLRSFITHDRGGDTQALASVGNYVLQGSHANRWIFADTTIWPDVTLYSRVDQFNWIGMFDKTTHEYIEEWVPQVDAEFTEGAWALYTDADNCVWFGGDFNLGDFVSGGGRKYIKGFSKFCQRDTVAPSTPTALQVDLLNANGPTITWGASTDDRTGFIAYEVLKNDRVISNLTYSRSFVDVDAVPGDRYFVRAVDVAGNRSATTAVVLARTDGVRPSTPTGLAGTSPAPNTVSLTWNPATDNVGVVGYFVYRNGVQVGDVPTNSATLTGQPGGNGSYQVAAYDAAGNIGARTTSITVAVQSPDTTRPSVPTGLAGTITGAGTADLTWNASTDNVGVVGYRVFRNSVQIADVPTNAASITGLLPGNNYIQVAAYDAAGNVGNRTSSLNIVVPVPDTTRPSVPTGLAGTLTLPNSVSLTWNASTDNVGVTGYFVYRNGVQIANVASPGVSLTGEPAGNNFYQVAAYDAAGNLGNRTASFLVAVPAPDTTRPSVPTNLVGTVTGAGTADLSWTASTDNVGVVGYLVYRNGVQIADVPTTVASVNGLLAGNNFIQVAAYDAAGNISNRTPSTVVVI